jgi:hypothetical protein
MATSSPQTQNSQTASVQLKSVWRKPDPSSQPIVNGITDEAHEKDSVSSKDLHVGEGSSQGQSTPASSLTDDGQSSSPTVTGYRLAPIPTVNPWKQRQEEQERKRSKDTQDAPPVLQSLDSLQKPSATAGPSAKSPTFTNKPNGVVKSEGNYPYLLPVLNGN